MQLYRTDCYKPQQENTVNMLHRDDRLPCLLVKTLVYRHKSWVIFGIIIIIFGYFWNYYKMFEFLLFFCLLLFSLTTLEFICSIFTVFLAITEPNTRNTVPTWTSKVAFLTLLPMGNWGIQQNQVITLGICNHSGHYHFLSSLWISCSTGIIISGNEFCLEYFLTEAGFLDLPLNEQAKFVSL